MNRAYVTIDTGDLTAISDAELLGRLASRLPFAMEPSQRSAWEYQINHLRVIAAGLPPARFHGISDPTHGAQSGPDCGGRRHHFCRGI